MLATDLYLRIISENRFDSILVPVPKCSTGNFSITVGQAAMFLEYELSFFLFLFFLSDLSYLPFHVACNL